MKALISNKLLRHSDMDVKVSVVTCITEITRITAPNAPFDDDQMKVHITNQSHYIDFIRNIKISSIFLRSILLL